ncbi:iron-siderophore ABC transporter substrate-binding protein [Planomonospora venezuelensis]|uniref:Iron complex transport system substrate-binding protein n=1 Tax=Planomonospora venezuelensis TaxID=1999 RepID=A0A841DA79_PLAVE|nr:iron-siderophore ABC transporter substrate-binding protein [Planomonospora venezuelensis]MBB5967522.1 iron complex transport system substrate-binding protein [Planomonospora venezuelensis]GIN04808.1 ABC transporter substrate-binding protein [Planomonospora venezuelensis]
MNPLRTALVAVAAIAVLGACGTTETAAPAPAASGGTASAAPITVTDDRGKQITLDRPAVKVVALEWGEAEMVVGLGVMPVGVADVKGYGTWVTAAKLDPSVKDVGTRQEPSVDSIVALQPDLIVMEAKRDSALVSQLEKFVPVIVMTGSDAKDNLGRMRKDLKTIATALGKTAEADKLLADMDAALADGKAKLAAAGFAGKPFVMADGWKDGSKISIRPFGKGALVSDVATQLGLTNAWTGEVDPVWGLGNTDVEGLTALKDPDTRFFYNASDGVDVFADGLASNAIWKKLPFVEKNQVTKLPDGIWTFGGPLSSKQYAEAVVKAYTG